MVTDYRGYLFRVCDGYRFCRPRLDLNGPKVALRAVFLFESVELDSE